MDDAWLERGGFVAVSEDDLDLRGGGLALIWSFCQDLLLEKKAWQVVCLVSAKNGGYDMVMAGVDGGCSGGALAGDGEGSLAASNLSKGAANAGFLWAGCGLESFGHPLIDLEIVGPMLRFLSFGSDVWHHRLFYVGWFPVSQMCWALFFKWTWLDWVFMTQHMD